MEKVREGVYCDYYDNNILKLMCNYKNGLLDGHYQEFYRNGALKKEGFCKENQKIGEWYKYDGIGGLISMMEFKDGNCIKVEKY